MAFLKACTDRVPQRHSGYLRSAAVPAKSAAVGPGGEWRRHRDHLRARSWGVTGGFVDDRERVIPRRRVQRVRRLINRPRASGLLLWIAAGQWAVAARHRRG